MGPRESRPSSKAGFPPPPPPPPLPPPSSPPQAASGQATSVSAAAPINRFEVIHSSVVIRESTSHSVPPDGTAPVGDRSRIAVMGRAPRPQRRPGGIAGGRRDRTSGASPPAGASPLRHRCSPSTGGCRDRRSEEHTSELQSRQY